ncbi:MAG TPA: ABC transporter permease, partial [Gemmatimonadaceae bacterium]|nr:ABC transporter permease [Gemmatimonadaceae bacterium]
FDHVGAAESWGANLTGGDRPESVRGLRITPDLLRALGVRPQLGRLLLDEEDEPGRDHAVVLGHGLWQRRFAGDPGVVGRTVQVNGEPYTVVGVMPRGFEFPPPFWAAGSEMWRPLALGPRAAERGGWSLRVFARLEPGASLDRARAEVDAINARVDRELPGAARDIEVGALKEVVVGDIRPALLVLLGAVGFVLLIACANVAHLLLARAGTRQREMAVRAALGAGRGRIVRQLLTESLLLALLGGGAGLALARWGTAAVVALSAGSIPRAGDVRLDGRVLAFAAALSLLTGVAFGLVPALRGAVVHQGAALREGGGRGSTAGGRRTRMRGVLVASEFALALVLLVGAGLMARSFAALRGIDPGFDARNVLTMEVSVAGSPQAAPVRRAAFYQDVLRSLRALPGVESAAAINHIPLGGDVWGLSFAIEGRPLLPAGEMQTATYRVVLPGYFRTMRIPVVRGRDVSESDRVGAPGAIVINEMFASRHWPGEDPIGKRLTFDDPRRTASPSWLTVVGVVKNVVRGSWSAPAGEEVYVPYLQEGNYLEGPGGHVAYLTFVLRADCRAARRGCAGAAAALAPAVREAVHAVDRGVPVSRLQTMDEVVAGATAEPRFYLFLFGAFAAVALTLAAVGIYGVMSYAVSRRTQEIGIRMALGAPRGGVLRQVVGQGMAMAGAGAMAGLAGAFALTRLMAGLLYGIRATDAASFAAAALALGAVALAASYLPARRATRIDPVAALRAE